MHSPTTQDYEKLGLFYLGRSFDPVTRQAGDDLVMYDSRDLVTHAVCVGWDPLESTCRHASLSIL